MEAFEASSPHASKQLLLWWALKLTGYDLEQRAQDLLTSSLHVGVLLKISDKHPYTFYIGVFPRELLIQSKGSC